ncbi:unnamed protein product [Peronospora farinosa]|uniref:Uncharacterized protein n=1 Tax=Peronospora farinosa TaxID=134698 RepID=A0AAV0SRT5_9STRA|nr:unnamed protein product [Peronospora farinosa]
MLSSKCDIVTTFIGVTNTGGLRFLGQAIIPMEPGWENKTKICAPLAKWKFPVTSVSKVSSNASLTSTAPVTPKKRPSSDSSLRKTLVTRWGVLTDTSFLLFDDTTAELLGSMYVLYVSSYAQQQLWEYKIILRRRASLIP